MPGECKLPAGANVPHQAPGQACTWERSSRLPPPGRTGGRETSDTPHISMQLQKDDVRTNIPADDQSAADDTSRQVDAETLLPILLPVECLDRTRAIMPSMAGPWVSPFDCGCLRGKAFSVSAAAHGALCTRGNQLTSLSPTACWPRHSKLWRMEVKAGLPYSVSPGSSERMRVFCLCARCNLDGGAQTPSLVVRKRLPHFAEALRTLRLEWRSTVSLRMANTASRLACYI